ncbi:MAG: Uxx-star family glutaredoxin-like (seleno)protein [Dehalococcoidia bacterium]|nr:Uxx-star family glutaredoxin-like (seleno)protein [Dehalococcoidia bacterium]
MARQVKIYTTPACPQCRAAKKYFKDKGVEYEELDVASNARARVEMFGIAQTRTVPVIVIDGQVLVGFDQGKIENKLFG